MNEGAIESLVTELARLTTALQDLVGSTDSPQDQLALSVQVDMVSRALQDSLAQVNASRKSLRKSLGGPRGESAYARRAACAYMYLHGIGDFGCKITSPMALLMDYGVEVHKHPERYPGAPGDLSRTNVLDALSFIPFVRKTRACGQSVIVLCEDTWIDCEYSPLRVEQIFRSCERRDDIVPLPVNLDFLE